MTQLDRLFNEAISQHGYWLINHRSIIEGDMQAALNLWGFDKTMQKVHEVSNIMLACMYDRIDNVRSENEY